MYIKFRLLMKEWSKKFSKKYYKMMKPLANYLDNRSNRKRQAIKDSITIEQTAKLIAKNLIKYLIRWNNSTIRFLVASYYNDDDFSGYRGLNYHSNLVKNRKASIGKSKFNESVELQLLIMEELKNMKNIRVDKEVEEFPEWRIIRDYEATYHILIKK